jgi:hypothetical protein
MKHDIVPHNVKTVLGDIMQKSDKKENITQLSGNTACIKHLMRTGKEQLHKDRVGDEYGKKLNKPWTEEVIVGKK